MPECLLGLTDRKWRITATIVQILVLISGPTRAELVYEPSPTPANEATSTSAEESSFFLQAAMAVMLGVSSVVFFYLNRSEEENEAEQDSHA